MHNRQVALERSFAPLASSTLHTFADTWARSEAPAPSSASSPQTSTHQILPSASRHRPGSASPCMAPPRMGSTSIRTLYVPLPTTTAAYTCRAVSGFQCNEMGRQSDATPRPLTMMPLRNRFLTPPSTLTWLGLNDSQGMCSHTETANMLQQNRNLTTNQVNRCSACDLDASTMS